MMTKVWIINTQSLCETGDDETCSEVIQAIRDACNNDNIHLFFLLGDNEQEQSRFISQQLANRDSCRIRFYKNPYYHTNVIGHYINQSLIKTTIIDLTKTMLTLIDNLRRDLTVNTRPTRAGIYFDNYLELVKEISMLGEYIRSFTPIPISKRGSSTVFIRRSDPQFYQYRINYRLSNILNILEQDPLLFLALSPIEIQYLHHELAQQRALNPELHAEIYSKYQLNLNNTINRLSMTSSPLNHNAHTTAIYRNTLKLSIIIHIKIFGDQILKSSTLSQLEEIQRLDPEVTEAVNRQPLFVSERAKAMHHQYFCK